MSQEVIIKEINTKEDYRAFVMFPFVLYKNNPNWVPPIIQEEMDTIDPNINPVYQNASARFFLAHKGDTIVGRIAAMVNWIEVKELKKSKVRFGWFDAIDDQNVTKLLIDRVIAFGNEHQLSFIEGPVGFSNLDKAGLLIEGFEEKNTMITLYNEPYYERHFEALGLTIQAKWVEYEIKISDFETSP